MFFILAIKKTNFQMDASEFKGLLYTMLYEKFLSNHRLDMKDENDDYIISDFVSQHFGITIGETLTCITCHATKLPKIFNDFSFIFPQGELLQEGKIMRPISHEKITHLDKSCVTMIDLMDEFYDKTELSDVICEEFTKSSSTTIKSNFENK